MELDKGLSLKRIVCLAVMYVIAIAGGVTVVMLDTKDMYDILSLIMYSVVLLTLIFIWLEIDRLMHGFDDEKHSNFARILIVFFFATVFTYTLAYFGVVLIPISLVSLAFSLITGPITGVLFGNYFAIMYFSIYTIDYQYFIMYLILAVVGAIIARLFVDKDTRVSASIITLCVYLALGCGTQYIVTQRLDFIYIGYVLAAAVISIFFSFMFALIVKNKVDTTDSRKVQKAIDDFDIIVDKIGADNSKEIDFVSQVAELSESAAAIIGADTNLAKAGGLYCRIGYMAGDVFHRDNAKVGEHFELPNNLIKLIHEAGAKKTIATSKESAIVILAYKSVKASRKIFTDASNLTFSKEVVVQQVFNNASSDGTLKDSGLSMDDYMKIKNIFSERIIQI